MTPEATNWRISWEGKMPSPLGRRAMPSVDRELDAKMSSAVFDSTSVERLSPSAIGRGMVKNSSWSGVGALCETRCNCGIPREIPVNLGITQEYVAGLNQK